MEEREKRTTLGRQPYRPVILLGFEKVGQVFQKLWWFWYINKISVNRGRGGIPCRDLPAFGRWWLEIEGWIDVSVTWRSRIVVLTRFGYTFDRFISQNYRCQWESILCVLRYNKCAEGWLWIHNTNAIDPGKCGRECLSAPGPCLRRHGCTDNCQAAGINQEWHVELQTRRPPRIPPIVNLMYAIAHNFIDTS